MYKVFFNESCFLLTDDHNSVKNDPRTLVHSDRETTREAVSALLSQPGSFRTTIYDPNIKTLFDDFKTCFKVVGAAGGIVTDRDSILMIRRLGMYDLPKGHIEPGETPETCAIREVEEECGIKQLQIIQKLQDTWHIYYRNEQWHLKQTFWFTMSCPTGQVLTPQTEEDIEEVFWMKTSGITQILDKTYASLRPLLQSLTTL